MSSPLARPLKFASLLDGAGIDRKSSWYTKDQVIFSKGDRNDALFYIESGSVKLAAGSHQGKEAIIGLLDGGDFFGEGCIAAALPVRAYTAIALTDSCIHKIPRTAIVHVLRSEGELSFMFISYLLEGMARVQADLASNLVNSSEQRLARLLISLSTFRGRSNLEFSVSQQTLAEMIGTTRQRVNLLMGRFRRLGFIEDAAGMKVHRSMQKIAPED